jgi:hypothetical protein
MFQKDVVEKIKSSIERSIIFFSKIVPFMRCGKTATTGQRTDDNITQRMRIACWITKATHKPSEYVTLIASPWQQWIDLATQCNIISALPFWFLYGYCLVVEVT